MRVAVSFTVGGAPVHVEVEDDETLLLVLRNHLGLQGTRYGCGMEQCGACMVLVDGVPVFSCTRPVATLAGASVETVEGLAQDGVLHPLQKAFLAEQAAQCGYCTSGILMSAKALLARNPSPTRQEIIEALDRHLCRCGTMNRIVRAVQRAAEAMR
jgi:nicotinate dehydrogenase subunit A